MGYGALSAFLLTPIATPEDIPAGQKTPGYWAERLAREWTKMAPEELEPRLMRFFTEFDRLSKAEQARQANGNETARQGP